MTQRERGRLGEQIANHPVVALLSVFGVLVAAVASAGTVVGWIKDARDSLAWRGAEYDRLTGLHAGLSVGEFEEVLGPPEITGESQDGRLSESLFKGRDFWVQAVSDRTRTVQMYLVTSCDRDFKPTFDIPARGEVTLRDTSFEDIAPVGPHRGHPIGRAAYEVSGATGNNRYMEYDLSSNPSNYQQFGWGLTDPCPDFGSQMGPKFELLRTLFGLSQEENPITFSGRARLTPTLTAFREKAIANTYAETQAQQTFEAIAAQIPIGVDRIRTRVVDEPEEKTRPLLRELFLGINQLLDERCNKPKFERPARCG